MKPIGLDLSLVVSLFIVYTHASSEIRGLHPTRVSLYSGQSFRCLDGSLTIPSAHINDDYCDCRDGTDEPGTSACPSGTFYCANKEYRPAVIPSSRVNDGICDCCDGSDEYSGRVHCSNICVELGRQMREEEEKQRLVLVQGHLTFKELAQQGANALSERQTRLAELEKMKQEVDAQKSEAERLKSDAERPESEAKDRHKAAWEAEKEKRQQEKKLVDAKAAFAELDANKDGQVSVTELQVHKEFDIDSNGEVSTEEAKEYLEDNEFVGEEVFLGKVWENIHQIYTTTTVQPPVSTTTTGSEQQDDPEKPLTTDELDEERYHDEEDDEDDDDDDDDGKSGTPEDRKSSEEDFPMPEYDQETKKLIEAADAARQQFRAVEDKLRDIDNEISDIKKLLELDLGPNASFYSLKGHCFDYTDREYTYSICPFDRASQRSKSGGGETSLGRWGEWSGPAENKYASMKFTGGQNCWNGPDRSAQVEVNCGLTNELVAASEPNRCEYAFVFNTPAACTRPPPDGSTSTQQPTTTGRVEL